MKKTNSQGGYVIESISGDASLKAVGSIRIGRVEGNLEASTPIGDIDIQEAKGNISAIAQSGNVNINKAFKHVSVEGGLGDIIIQSAKSDRYKRIFLEVM